MSKIKYKVGDVLEVETFAGIKIYKRVVEKITKESKWTSLTDSSKKDIVKVSGFEGCFVRRKDLYALKEHSVPYSGKENMSKTISWTYDHQIIRLIRRCKDGR